MKTAPIASQPADPANDEASAHTLAVMVLAELRRHHILPTPRNYDLWFTFRLGANSALTDRMGALIASSVPVTSAALSVLHEEFIAPPGRQEVTEDDGVETLRDIAEDLSDEVATGQDAMHSYSDALTRISAQLAGDPTVGSLVDALGTMATETSRASERNRHLERQLATCGARIERLRRLLLASKAEATTDQLTGLMNRRAFEARLRRALTQVRAEPEWTFSLLMLDVDHFKLFNDEHGHTAGDFVLRMLARLMRETVKGRDVVARYGGEEFVILLPGTPRSAAAIVGRLIVTALSERRLVHRPSHKKLGMATVSIGVAEVRTHDTILTLVERADTALYVAKAKGRNRVSIEEN